MKIGLDSMIFIYLFEADVRFIKPITGLFEKIEKGKLQAVTSIISVTEVLSATKLKDQPEKITAFTQFFRKLQNFEVVPVEWEIADIAAKLRREFPVLRTPDAIQLATALYAEADEFVTNDIKLAKLPLPVKISLISKIV